MYKNNNEMYEVLANSVKTGTIHPIVINKVFIK